MTVEDLLWLSGLVVLAVGFGSYWLGRWSARPRMSRGLVDLLSSQLAFGADIFARKVENDAEFAAWKQDFEVWRDFTFAAIEAELGESTVNILRPLGSVTMHVYKNAYHPEHDRYKSILQTYMDRVRDFTVRRGAL